MTNNTTQKNLIEALTKTHPEPARAYLQAIKQAQTNEARQYLQRVADALGVEL